MGTKTMDMDKEYVMPILCGGTFFTLILQAGKQGLNERKKWASKSGALSQGTVLEALIKITTPSYTISNDAVSFKSVVSEYKSCKISQSGQLPLSDQAIISAFDKRIKTDYQKTVAVMSDFAVIFLDVDVKGEWLIKALLELIAADQTILSTDEFYIYPDGSKCTKLFLASLSKFCLPSFLLGLWHFIVTKRTNNSVGKDTYNLWHSVAVSKGAKKVFSSKIGDTIQKQITLLPFVANSTKNTETETIIDEVAAADDSDATAESFITSNNSGVKYQQNNYSQTINVSGGTNVINGFVINPPGKRRSDE